MNSGFVFKGQIEAVLPGSTLLDYLARHHPHSSAKAWRARILAGQVSLDDHIVDPLHPVHPGQRLIWRRPPWREPDAPLRFDLLHRDPHLLAVAKPAGLPTLPGAGFLDHTLLRLVREGDARAVPMHRLGRWTSGVVLFARTPEARGRLAEDWREGRVEKRYRALASGSPKRDAFSVTTPIGPVPYPPLGSVHAANASGKPSQTYVRVLERRGQAFLADVRIDTGRPHQIRIHLAAAGHPLVGDPLYGVGGLPLDGTRALPGDSGYALHAARLVVPHPSDRRAIRLEAPIPGDLRHSRG